MRAFLAIVLGLAISAPAAYGASQRDWNDCNSSDSNRMIAGCTRVLADKVEDRRDRAIAYNNRGNGHLAKRNYDRAIADYDEAIRVDPKYAHPHHNRGLAYYNKRDYNRAIVDLNEAVRLDPKYADAYNRRGLAHVRMYSYHRALDDFDQAIRLDPKLVHAYNNRGLIHHDMGDYSSAIADYDAAIRLDSTYTGAYVNRGLAFQRNGDSTRALADFKSALSMPPKYENGEWAHRTARERLAALEKDGATLSAVSNKVDPPPDTLVPPDSRVALVIGNSSYRHAPSLANPRNDATEIAASLERLGFTVRKEYELEYDGLRRTLREFAQDASSADIAAIFFAGHGLEVDGHNYLIPVDARLATDRDVAYEAIPLDYLLRAVEGAGELGLVLLDSCRDNPFLSSMQMASATRSLTRGLSRVEPSGSVLVGFAAKEGTVAADGDGRNSPYTAALLKHLETPKLEIRLLFGKVRDEVRASTDGAQEPYVYGSLGGDAIYLADATNAVVNQEPVQSGVAAEAPQEREHVLRLGKKDWLSMQAALVGRGFDPGRPDGIPGDKTRSALKSWQRSLNLADTGYLTASQYISLLNHLGDLTDSDSILARFAQMRWSGDERECEDAVIRITDWNAKGVRLVNTAGISGRGTVTHKSPGLLVLRIFEANDQAIIGDTVKFSHSGVSISGPSRAGTLIFPVCRS